MKTIIFLATKKGKMLIRTLFFLILLISFSSCTPDDEITKNPFLPELSFTLLLNLSLPEFNNLNFPGNSYVTYNNGINGIVIYNINNSQYAAFELSDPNHSLRECSRLTVRGIIASCSCEDGNSYNILTGEISTGTGQYSLKPYRVRKSGNVLEVFN